MANTSQFRNARGSMTLLVKVIMQDQSHMQQNLPSIPDGASPEDEILSDGDDSESTVVKNKLPLVPPHDPEIKRST